MINPAPEDYEYAIRVIHRREELKEEEVRNWLEVSGHRELLEEVAAVRMSVITIKPIEKKLVKKKLHRRFGRTLRLWTIGTIAASVLVAFGIRLFVLFSANMPEPASELAVIRPGYAKAHLILADGQVVDLRAEVKNISLSAAGVIRNDSLEGLKYTEDLAATQEYNRLQVPVGGFYKLELSDGTRVWLNSQSELRFPVVFTDTLREVWLEGEGYFEVNRKGKKQFRVHAGQAIITVMGTSFNISAYAGEQQVYTTLVEGTVEVCSEAGGKTIVLQPGKQCIYDRIDGEMSVRVVDPSLYAAWRDGRFVFRFVNLETIVKQLQRWYDFEVCWLDAGIKEYEFRGVILRDSGVEDVFRAIELATDVRFKIQGKQVTIEKK